MYINPHSDQKFYTNSR